MARYHTELKIGDKRFSCTVRSFAENGHQKYGVYLNERASIFGRYEVLGFGFGYNIGNKNETVHNTLDEAIEQLRAEIKRQIDDHAETDDPAEYEQRTKEVLEEMIDEYDDVERYREHENHVS